MSLVYTESFHCWTKCVKAYNVAQRYLTDIAQNTWNRYIFKIGHENVEKFVECLFTTGYYAATIHSKQDDCSCKHVSCRKVFLELESLLTEPAAVNRKRSVAEVQSAHTINVASCDKNVSETIFTSRLDNSFVLAFLFHCDGNKNAKAMFTECNFVELTEMMRCCKLFNAIDCVGDFDNVSSQWRSIMCLLENGMQAEQVTVHFETMMNLFRKLRAVDKRSYCEDAIRNLREIASMNFASEYGNREYLVFAKRILEITKSAIEEVFAEAKKELLEKTDKLIQSIDENLNREEENEMEQLKLLNEVMENDRPGRPKATRITPHSIKLSWDPSKKFVGDDYYQVSYKINDRTKKWKFLTEEYSKPEADVINLIPKTKYIFRVRLVSQHGEGPSSQESDEYTTERSPVSEIANNAELIEKSDTLLAKYRLPKRQIYENSEAKIRTFEIGTPKEDSELGKTIILVGDDASEKNRFIDVLVNYMYGINWSDPFRFTVTDLQSEKIHSSETDQTKCSTEWISLLLINTEPSSRIKYQIRLIDITPSSNTPENETDEQLNRLCFYLCQKAITDVNALCFFPFTTTEGQLHSVFSCLGNDFKNRICAISTTEMKHLPSVLPGLAESKIPLFTFKNSTTCYENERNEIEERFLWEMDMNICDEFFSHLRRTRPCSFAITKEVITYHLQVKDLVLEIKRNLEIGYTKVAELKTEKQHLLEVKNSIRQNANYLFEEEEDHYVKEIIPGKNSTICLECRYTCHDKCSIDSENKESCIVMKNGKCTKCRNNCLWSLHTIDNFVFKKDGKHKVLKRNDDVFRIYQQATDLESKYEKTLEAHINELKEFCERINNLMQTIYQYGKKINENALFCKLKSSITDIEGIVSSFNEIALREIEYT